MKGQSRSIYLVNGLDKPYTVKVNDRTYPVGARGKKMIEISEGQVEIGVVDESLDIADRTYTVKTPFFTRPFVSHTFIVNPDQTAVVYWEKTWYAEEPEDFPDGQEKVYVGQPLYSFDGIDFVFRPFPSQIDIGGSKVASRTRLSLLTDDDVNPSQVPWILAEVLGQDVAVDYLLKRIACEPENEGNLYPLMSMTRSEQFIEIIKPGLAARPVRLQWHTIYQFFMERARPTHDLEAEYRKLLDDEPENKSLQYLFGCVLTDSAQAELHLEESISGDAPCPYGYAAIAYRRLSMGRFAEALENIRIAVDLAPENVGFRNDYYTILQATDNCDELIRLYRQSQNTDPENFRCVEAEAILLTITGRPQEAKKRMDAWVVKNKGAYSDEALDAVRESMAIEFAYLSGDLVEYGRLAKAASDATYRFQYCVSSGEPAEPNCVDQIKSESPYAVLLLYMSQYLAGDIESAERYLVNAVDYIGAQGRQGKVIAAALCALKEPDAESICQLAMAPKTKAIALTAMGLRYPSQKERYFALARKLNFDRTFPYLFLKGIHEKTLTKAP
jgi:Flp pilus assembly protein TadD